MKLDELKENTLYSFKYYNDEFENDYYYLVVADGTCYYTDMQDISWASAEVADYSDDEDEDEELEFINIIHQIDNEDLTIVDLEDFELGYSEEPAIQLYKSFFIVTDVMRNNSVKADIGDICMMFLEDSYEQSITATTINLSKNCIASYSDSTYSSIIGDEYVFLASPENYGYGFMLCPVIATEITFI